ncbi:MAG: hypothetical protein EWM72_01891 [Nitrospira sp.]|nr:MAG: hypothetical protein EWM72_01891 [Nitrospira sp.]
MGRRRHQHSGGLALASDQIPGQGQNNIGSGLVTLSACLPGLSQSSKAMLLQTEEKTQVQVSIVSVFRGISMPVALKAADAKRGVDVERIEK